MNFWKRYPCRPHTPSHPPGISLQHFFLSWDSQRRWGRAPKKTKKGVAFFPPKQRGGRSFPYPIYKICSKTKWEPLPPPIVCPFTTHWKYKIQEPWQINEPDTIRPCHDMWIQTCHKNTWTNYSPMWMWKWHRESRPSPISSLPVTEHRQHSHVGLHRVPVPQRECAPLSPENGYIYPAWSKGAPPTFRPPSNWLRCSQISCYS